MNRRRSIVQISYLLGLSVVGFNQLNQSCKNIEENEDSNIKYEELIEIISEIANILIPDTNPSGENIAQVGSFILMMIEDCYNESIRKIFIEGVLNINNLSKVVFDQYFLNISIENKRSIVESAFKEEQSLKDSENKNLSKTLRSRFFKLFRDLAYLRYFTSEIGCTQVLEYVHVPGIYEGCIEMELDQRAWAT